MTARTTPMTRADVAARAAHARGFLSAAEIIDQFSDDVADEAAAHVVGSLAVLAGIAATDAICGLALGRRAAGDNHDEAVALVKTATQGREFARDLARLLGAKSNVQYSPRVVTVASSRELVKYAGRLVDGMSRLLRS